MTPWDHHAVPATHKSLPASPALAGALERAAAAFARLDHALQNHPLRSAFLYRSRLDAVRRQAAIDGQSIDPWHLAAVLEGLRLRMDGALRIIDRGMIFEAARHALTLHQWIVAPDFDQEGEVQIAERALALTAAAPAPLLSAALSMHAWLQAGGTRPPIRAALIRHWTKHRLLHAPVPLTGPRALGAEAQFEAEVWIPVFLEALADEAADALQLLQTMERAWFTARAAVASRRSTSRAAAAVDVLAAAPLVSATTLATGLSMAVKNAIALLEAFAESRDRRRGDPSLQTPAVRTGRARAAATAGTGARAGPAAGDPGGAGAAAATARSAADADRAQGDRLQRTGALDGACRPGNPRHPPQSRRLGPGR